MKRGFYLSLFFILILFIVSLASSLDTDSLENSLDNTRSNLENVKETTESLSNEDIRTDYLKKEWSTILNNSSFLGPVVRGLDGFFTFSNPFFKIVLGVDYSLSWAFIFSFIFWLALFFLFYSPSATVSNSSWIGLLFAFAFSSILGLLGIIREIVAVLSLLVNNPYWLFLFFIISIVLVFVFKKIGLSLSKMLKDAKKKSIEEQEEQDRKIKHLDAKITAKKLGVDIKEKI